MGRAWSETEADAKLEADTVAAALHLREHGWAIIDDVLSRCFPPLPTEFASTDQDKSYVPRDLCHTFHTLEGSWLHVHTFPATKVAPM